MKAFLHERQISTVIRGKHSTQRQAIYYTTSKITDDINEKLYKVDLIAITKRASLYVDEDNIRIMTAFIRTSLEFCAVVWSLLDKKDIDKLEKSSKAGTFSMRNELRWTTEKRT